jgi:predicted MFS family arabinose efflux permease
VIGDHAGWRGTFAYAGLVALLAAAVTRLVLPALPGSPRRADVNYGLIAQPGIVRGLALTLIGFAAAFTIVAFIGPLATAIAGLNGSGIAAVQALIGVGSIAGIVLGGRTAGGPSASRVLWLSFAVAALTSLFYAVLLSLPVTAESVGGPAQVPWLTLAVFVTGMVVGAGALFARIPIIQTDLANASPPELRPVVFGLNGSLVLFGQGLGAAIGGVAIGIGGLFALGVAASGLAVVGCLVAFGAVARPVHPATTVAPIPARSSPR